MLCDPNVLAAFLYRQMAECEPLPPKFDLDTEQGREDYITWGRETEEWYLQPIPTVIDLTEATRFLDQTSSLLSAIEALGEDQDASEYQTLFYDAAKAMYDGDKKMIRRYFTFLYYVLYERDNGSRWGDLIAITGVEGFVNRLRTRFAQLL